MVGTFSTCHYFVCLPLLGDLCFDVDKEALSKDKEILDRARTAYMGAATVRTPKSAKLASSVQFSMHVLPFVCQKCQSRSQKRRNLVVKEREGVKAANYCFALVTYPHIVFASFALLSCRPPFELQSEVLGQWSWQIQLLLGQWSGQVLEAKEVVR